MDKTNKTRKDGAAKGKDPKGHTSEIRQEKGKRSGRSKLGGARATSGDPAKNTQEKI